MLGRDGVILDDQLARHRLTHADIRQTLRSSGVGDLGEVAAVILESDGSRSVITGSQLGNGSVLDDVPGWPRRDAD
ncbi:YetF domain-containing protein [Dietzia maris]|uniref:YetF domain-containing protein n=1 Tax=Dietzia maris TaxID=37915 RepID=UPI00232E1453|nr:YetF domain-containing protein [Dietzia maris]